MATPALPGPFSPADDVCSLTEHDPSPSSQFLRRHWNPPGLVSDQDRTLPGKYERKGVFTQRGRGLIGGDTQKLEDHGGGMMDLEKEETKDIRYDWEEGFYLCVAFY